MRSAKVQRVDITNVLAVDPNFDIQPPSALENCNFVASKGSVNQNGLRELFQDRNAAEWLSKNAKDSAVLLLNTAIPHFNDLYELLLDIFSMRPRLIIIRGGFFDMIGPIRHDGGSATHLFTRKDIDKYTTRYNFKVIPD